jgi:hypothetical protein
MNHLAIRSFANQTSLLLPDTAKRRMILPALIGMAIGNFLQVKQGDELNPLTVFNSLHIANVSRAVSFLNEEILIDVPAAIEAAKTMYMVRHRIFNGSPADYSVNPEFDFMSIALGLSAVLPVETYQVIKESGLSAAKVYTLANLMIGDLKKAMAVTL